MKATFWVGLALALALIGSGAFAWYRAEGQAPVLSAPDAMASGAAAPETLRIPETLRVGASGRVIGVELADAGSGLRGFDAVLAHAAGQIPLVTHRYPGNLLSGGTRGAQQVDVRIRPEQLGEVRGEAVLRLAVRDWSWRGRFAGNETRVDLPVAVDLEPPRVSIANGLTYVRQGGSGVVAYRISEPTRRDGVRVGEGFYRGYPRPGSEDERVAIFAVPALTPRDAPIRVVAEDLAGNTTEARWSVVVQPRTLRDAHVTLTSDFLERVVRPLAESVGGANGDLPAAFHRVNTTLRAQSEATVREHLAASSSVPLWTGPLRQLANSQVTSRFGERRLYFADGKQISRAVHYGYDLASTGAAPVTAAGAGRVAFAGDLGIYGNCVLIDHGLGVGSLYGHLSELEVRSDDAVAALQQLGRSGATGLAGGDHLHFAILVGDTYVDPLEWWDPRWVQSHVDARLRRSTR